MIENCSARISDVAAAPASRCDAHFFLLTRRIAPLVADLSWGTSMTRPSLLEVSNGANLPKGAYEQDADSTSMYAYASVGAISQFVLRISACQPLKDPSEFAYGFDLDSIACKPNEVLVTRSGTPGVAWPVTMESDVKIIPSGFVIRVLVNGPVLMPGYLAGILVHPVWRIWTSALAAGKRQRNISQEQLAAVRVPAVAISTQARIAEAHGVMMRDISEILEEEAGLLSVCDSVISAHGVRLPPLQVASLTADAITLADCARSDVLRIDGRFHRSDIRKVFDAVSAMPGVSLVSLAAGGVVKNKHPLTLQDGDDGDGRVVATSSIQAGQVVEEMTKPTTEDQIVVAGEKALRRGDIVVTVDGEGSIGKAAVFTGEYPAVTDSHVAVLRLSDEDLAWAVACFLGSSGGQAQFLVATTGSTGQTQVSRTDLARFHVPTAVLSSAPSIAKSYKGRLAAFEPLTRRIRRRLCTFASQTSELLIAESDLPTAASGLLGKWSSEDKLLELLSVLRPDMF